MEGRRRGEIAEDATIRRSYIAFIVATSKALVTRSDALVTSSLWFLFNP